MTDMSNLLIETTAAAAAVLLATTGLLAVCTVTFTTAFLLFRLIKAVVGMRRSSAQAENLLGSEVNRTVGRSP